MAIPPSRAHSRSTFERWSWYFMRISGVVLLFIAVFHLLWMHLVIGLDNVEFETIVARWTGPLGPFWRVYDLLLLVFALTHGMNGLRWVIDDYVHGRGANTILKAVFGLLFVTLITMGAYVIFTFSAPPEIVLRGAGL